MPLAMDDVKPYVSKFSKMSLPQITEYFKKDENRSNKPAWIAYWMMIHFLDPAANLLQALLMQNKLENKKDNLISDELAYEIEHVAEIEEGTTNRQYMDKVYDCLNKLTIEQFRTYAFK